MDLGDERRDAQNREPEVEAGGPQQAEERDLSPAQVTERVAPIASIAAGFSSEERSPGSCPR